MSAWFSLRKLSLSRGSSSSKPSAPASGPQSSVPVVPVPETQTILLLHGPKQPYQLVDQYPVPKLLSDKEVLVRTRAIGLNPIDWKAPDFNFGLPELPYIAGRELAGEVVQTASQTSDWKINDRVIAISTDYRDLRKAAYQEYVVALEYNLVRLPPSITYEQGSTLGVAFAAAALALGISAGLDFSPVQQGPDLFKLVRDVGAENLPEDVRHESLESIDSKDRLRPGDWLAIWGGSATTANIVIQIAKLFGIKTVVVVDKAKHGLRLSNHHVLRPDLLVDSHDPQRAIEIIKANTRGRLRFGLDTRGRETATHLLEALSPSFQAGAKAENLPSPPSTPQFDAAPRSHLIGLTGLPRGSPPAGIVYHAVPIKLFHEVPQVGQSLVTWLGLLLEKKLLVPPEVIDVEDGLSSINAGLDRMRSGEISGGKLVVQIK